MQKLRKGLSFLVNRKLALGYSGWKHCVSLAHSQEKKQAAMKRAMSYFINRNLSRRLGWMAHAVGGEGGVPAQATQRSWQNDEQEAAAGFSSWQEAVAPRDDPMARALKHLLNKELSRGWVAWHAQWEEKRAKMESMRRSLGHALNRQLSAGFLSWREMAEERAEFMRHLRKGAAFLVNRGLALGFGGWKHCVSLAHSQDKKQAAMKRAMSYFLNKELSRGWGGWHQMWAEKVEFLRKLRNGLGKMMNKKSPQASARGRKLSLRGTIRCRRPSNTCLTKSCLEAGLVGTLSGRRSEQRWSLCAAASGML